MIKSQNGWPVQSSSKGLWKHPQVGPILSGAVWVVFNWFLSQYEATVEPIGRYSGSWNHRKIKGSAKWSNHASATAVDLNWKAHPAGHGPYAGFTTAQRATVKALLKRAGGVLRWGGPAFNDPMHFEIAPGVTLAQVEKLATSILQAALSDLGYDLGRAGVDGVRGVRTLGALTAFQTDHSLTVDQVDGPATWAAIAAASAPVAAALQAAATLPAIEEVDA